MAKSLFILTFRTLLFCLFLLFPSVAFAAVVDGLFNATVEVQNQQSSLRDQAFNDGLRQVLLKLSGNSNLINEASFVDQFFPAEKYVVRFSYKDNPAYAQFLADAEHGNTQESVTPPQDDTGDLSPPLPMLFQVQFSEQILERDLTMSGMPIWGNIRPTVQIWVVLETQGKRQLLGEKSPHKLLESLKTTAENFVLPVIFPEADTLDAEQINVTNLWGLFPDALDGAKVRYQADVHLMIRVYKSFSNTWSANWLLIQPGSSSSNSLVDTTLSNISRVIISDVAKVISDRYSIKKDSFVENNEMTIEISNINSFKDFIELETFLENITPVKTVGFNWVQGSTLSVKLSLNSTRTQLIEYINLSGKLKHIGSSSVDLNIAPAGKIAFLNPETGQVMPNIEQFQWLHSTSPLKLDTR